MRHDGPPRGLATALSSAQFGTKCYHYHLKQLRQRENATETPAVQPSQSSGGQVATTAPKSLPPLGQTPAEAAGGEGR